MNNTAVDNTYEQTEISNADITAALNAILGTDKFSASPQMSAFLKYVVEQTQLGNTRRIKAFTVGLEALGKPASFDPQTDPSVRVLAKRLRHSLDTYYLQHPDTTIIIDMKPGSYVPKFLIRALSDVQPVSVASPAVTTQTTKVGNTDTMALPASQYSTNHLRLTQPAGSAQAENNETHTSQNDPVLPTVDQEAQQQSSENIQRLWQAYRSAPKIA